MLQLNFFRKGLRSLEAVDAHVRLMAEQEHIDYPFCGNEDNDRDDDEDDGDDDGEDGNNAYEDGELSFDYRRNKHGLDASTSRNSMEVRIHRDLKSLHTACAYFSFGNCLDSWELLIYLLSSLYRNGCIIVLRSSVPCCSKLPTILYKD